jgi:hypothetical protein
MRNLVQQLEVEIVDVERRLTFWRQQTHLRAGTDLSNNVWWIIENYEKQLEKLQETKRLLDA